MNNITKASLAIFSFAISVTSSYSMATQTDDFYSFLLEDGRTSSFFEVVEPEFDENKRWQSVKKNNNINFSASIICGQNLCINSNFIIKKGGMICIKQGEKFEFGPYGKIIFESSDPENFDIKNYIKEIM